jgi:hypothetical protein
MIQLKTAKILMVIISFGGHDRLDKAVERATELLGRYAEATDVETGVVE